MGWTWEVREWLEDDTGQYAYVPRYQGESVVRALITAIRLKRRGAGCVMVEWR